MYTFRALECVVNNNQRTVPANSADSVIDACNLAELTLRNISERLDALTESCRNINATKIVEFPYLRDEILALVALTSHEDKPLFDGHIDADISLSSNTSDSVRVHVPDLIGRMNQFRSNFKAVASCTTEDFADRMRVSDGSVYRAEATVQGVRLNTFTPKPCRSNRISVVNSLTELTGLHALSYGNAMVAPMVCADTEMPLNKGCFLINDYEVPSCNGSVESLIASINTTTHIHGVVADGKAGDKIVLMRPDGGIIDVKVHHQAGSLLSGFPCGSSHVEAATNGLIVWLSFRHLSHLSFDSSKTGELLSGDEQVDVPMRSGMLADLSLHTDYEQKVTRFVLEFVSSMVKQECNNISHSLEQFRMLLRSRKQQLGAEVAFADE